MPHGRRGKGDPKRVPDSRAAPGATYKEFCGNSVNTGPMADVPSLDENNPMFAECQHPVVAIFLVFLNGMPRAVSAVTADSQGAEFYFPEEYLSLWFRQALGEDVSIWCFPKPGYKGICLLG